MKRRNKLALLSVYLTFFIDNLCWSIVFPIFAPYFLNPQNPLFVSLSLSERTALLGFFLMAFSLGQFIAAPVIGGLADRFGRKRVLITTIFSTFLGLMITAWSMQSSHLLGLFLGRLITGIASSNGSVCLACVSDLSSDNPQKMKNFGHFSSLAGFSFVLGAFVGGKLADPTISSYFSPSLPIWIASTISLLNLLFVLFGFQETVHLERKKHPSALSSFKNIKSAMQTKSIINIYIVYFLFIFSWTIILQFTPVVLIKEFAFTSSNIGDLALFVGSLWALGSSYLKQWITNLLSPIHALKASLFFLTLFAGILVLPNAIYEILIFLGACVILGSVAWPLCTTAISNLAPLNMQGKVMGISQSVQSFAMTIAPALAGVAFNASVFLPFLIGALALLGAAILCSQKISHV